MYGRHDLGYTVKHVYQDLARVQTCGPYTQVVFICRFNNMESISLGTLCNVVFNNRWSFEEVSLYIHNQCCCQVEAMLIPTNLSVPDSASQSLRVPAHTAAAGEREIPANVPWRTAAGVP